MRAPRELCEGHRAYVSARAELLHVFNSPIWEAGIGLGPHHAGQHEVNFAELKARGGRAIIEFFLRRMSCQPSKGKWTRLVLCGDRTLAITGGVLSRLATSLVTKVSTKAVFGSGFSLARITGQALPVLFGVCQGGDCARAAYHRRQCVRNLRFLARWFVRRCCVIARKRVMLAGRKPQWPIFAGFPGVLPARRVAWPGVCSSGCIPSHHCQR